ncbi:transposase family protein [Kitasatospora sp. NPDC058046]|uniref:transposase family protein n=1 Tax=Kitasatospora sp. NPDC058046 TaxID=3346312 RepID=UPI0036DC9438
MLCDQTLKVLLPQLSGLVVEEVRDAETGLRITARTACDQARCPQCGASSTRVHDRYRRRIADLAVGGRAVTIALSVRRFRCETSGCPRRTFAEQIEGLTFRYGRRSLLQRGLPPDRQTPGPRQGAGRRRPLDPRHSLAPDQRPGRPLPGPRRGLAPTPPEQRPPNPRPRPPAPSPRPPGHPRPHCLTEPDHEFVRSAPRNGRCRLPG